MALNRKHVGVSAAAALLAAAAPCFAQQHAMPGMRNGASITGVPPLLQRVEQNVADVGPLSDTLREVNFQVDPRDPVGFSNVYKVPGRDDLFMRSSGAVYAVFTQSQYIENERGTIATVPAGTMFSIGMPAAWTLPQRPIEPSKYAPGGPPKTHDVAAYAPSESNGSSRHNTRVRTLVSGSVNATDQPTAPVDDDNLVNEPPGPLPPDASKVLRTIATDEAYRAERLAELMRQASQASSGG